MFLGCIHAQLVRATQAAQKQQKTVRRAHTSSSSRSPARLRLKPWRTPSISLASSCSSFSCPISSSCTTVQEFAVVMYKQMHLHVTLRTCTCWAFGIMLWSGEASLCDNRPQIAATATLELCRLNLIAAKHGQGESAG